MLYIREKGSVLPTGRTVQQHDLVKVAREGQTIEYQLNGETLYKSLDHSNEDLQGMVVINTAALSIGNLYLSTTGDVLLADNEYNEIGELIDKKLHSLDGGMTARQSLDYRYNIRGWLQGVNAEGTSEQSTARDSPRLLLLRPVLRPPPGKRAGTSHELQPAVQRQHLGHGVEGQPGAG